MATIKQIRDDLTAEIALMDAITTRGITPVAMWVPQWERTSALPAVIVAPASRSIELIARDVVDKTTRLQVAVLESLKGDPEAAGAAGHVIMDAIVDGLLARRLSGESNAVCTRAQILTLNSPEHWRERQQFVGVVELTFRA